MLQKLLITLTLASVALGGLTVWQPSDLAKKIKNETFVISNMGKYQYGKTLQGKIVAGEASGEKSEGKELTISDGCDNMKSVQGDKSGDKANVNAIFLYVKSGGCDHMTKTRYAEIAGASLVIIQYDDDNIDQIFSDSGSGSYGIPAIIVKRGTGDELDRGLKNNNHIIVAVHFSVPQSNKVVYELWISSSLETAYTFLEKFQKMHNLFEDKIKIEPHYVLWYCFHCRLSDFKDETNINCLSGGRFCAPDPDATGPMSGREVVLEDLRQKCIYKLNYEYYPDKWWGYMTNYRATCLEPQNITQDCSESIMKAQSISAWEVDDCVKDSFKKEEGSKLNMNKDDNPLLEKERELFMDKKIGFWPALIVNNMTYKGSLDNVLEVFDTVCAGFYSRPDICDLFYEPNPEDHPSNILIIIIVVVVLLGFFFFMIVVYRRMIKRELTMQMESQISTIVSQYYSMPAEGKNIPGMAKKEDY